MQEQDIRPAKLMSVKDELESRDISKVLARRAEFVKVNCPACTSDNYEFSFQKQGFDFVTCRGCETLFVNPRPTSEILSEHYRTSEMIAYWNDQIYPASEDARRVKIFKPRAERVVQLCKAHGSSSNVLLDVGAGYGTFCEEVKALNYFKRVVALEPGEGLAESCRRKGIEVIEDMVETAELAGGADVITNFELIEHVFDPANFIEKCSRLLNPNGLLIITTPNILGFDLMVLREKSDNIAAPNHINYFHPDSLSALMKRCGLSMVEVQTPGQLDADIVRNKVAAGVLDVSDNLFFRQIFVERADELVTPFQAFLADNKLSSHMWLVARKDK